MTAILNVLLEITIYSAILYGAILLFKSVFRKHISAALSYAVWALLIVRLLMPVTIDSGFSLFVIPEPQAPVVQSADTADISPAAQVNDTLAVPQAALKYPSSYEPQITGTNVVNNSSPEPSVNINIDWRTALVLLWAAGVLVSAAVVVALGRRLKCQIRLSGREVPPYVLELIEECKRDLGIKNELRVTMHDWLNSPALSVALCPRLLLPAGMLAMSRRQLEYGIRHELTHCKRRDHLKSLLLIALRCFYWFNPVVWLSFPQIQADMETLCDVDVTSRLQKAERVGYINTMVELSCMPNVRYILGMGLCKGRRALENRVKGIYMKRKTKLPVRMAAILIAAIMMIACFTTACQPTPEKEIVVNRNDLEGKIQSSAPSATAYEAPAHWTDTESRDDVTVSADTDVTLPNATQYPVTILEPVTFSQKRLDELVHYFAGDSKLFCYPSVFTKADYEKMLVEAERGQLVDGKYVVTEDTKKYAESLKEKVANAPEDSPRMYTDTALTYETDLDGNVNYDSGQNYLNVGIEFGQGKEATISAQNFTQGYGSSTRFSFSRIGLYTKELYYKECLTHGSESDNGLNGYGAILGSINLDKDAAKAQAEKVVSDLGIKDMALVNEEKAVFKSLENQYGVSNNQPNRGGYVFEYVRSSGGIPGFQLTSFGTNGYEQPPDYSPPFFQEMLTIAVSADGIEEFNWSGLAKVVKTESGNVSLLPFGDIQQALINQIYYEQAPMLEEFNESEAAKILGEHQTLTVNVLSAKLRIGYINVKDNTRQAMLVPMWVFETSETHTYGGDKSDTYGGKTYQFNAIDGGVITPSMSAYAKEEEAKQSEN